MKRLLQSLIYTALASSLVAAIAVANTMAAELRVLPEKAKFTLTSATGVNVKFETLAGKKIECKKGTGSGEFTSERLGTVEFKWVECEEPTLKVKCTGLSDTTSGTITVKGEFHTRHLLPNSEGINVAVLLTSSVHYSCSIVLYVVSGCSASMDMLTEKGGVSAVNLLRSSDYLDFLQEKGDGKPTEIDIDNSLGMEKCELTTKEGSSAAESSGALGEGTVGSFTNSKNETVTELTDLSGTF